MILTSKDLVGKFGNDKQKEYFLKYGKIPSGTKTAILNKAKMFCNILDKGKGEYEVIEFYSSPLPKQLFTIKENEIYKVFCPLIIHKLIGRHDKNNALTSSLINYYGGMQIIHKDNYNTIRYNTKVASKELNLDIKKTIRDKYNIIDDKDLFFNKLYKEAKREYEEELIKHNIVYFYEGYEVYYKDIDKAKSFMNNFLDFKYNEYSNKLSDIFIKNVLENTENRHEFSEELIKIKGMSDVKYLCENTLKFDVEDVVLSENIININDGDYHSYTSTIYENN